MSDDKSWLLIFFSQSSPRGPGAKVGVHGFSSTSRQADHAAEIRLIRAHAKACSIHAVNDLTCTGGERFPRRRITRVAGARGSPPQRSGTSNSPPPLSLPSAAPPTTLGLYAD